MDDLQKVMAGQCIHGKGSNCLTCSLTRFLAFKMRSTLQAVFSVDENKGIDDENKMR